MKSAAGLLACSKRLPTKTATLCTSSACATWFAVSGTYMALMGSSWPRGVVVRCLLVAPWRAQLFRIAPPDRSPLDRPAANSSSLEVNYLDVANTMPVVAIWLADHPHEMLPILGDAAK